MTVKPVVEFENDRVRVTRVKGSGALPATKRHDRLVVYLRDGHIHRKEGGRQEELHRRAGEVVWRGRSEHEIAAHDDEHEVLIVELKS
jgi:hypothetical protein